MTTIDFTSAQNALDRELVRLESLTVLRDAVRDIGGLQQSAAEAQTRMAAARTDEAAAQASLEKIQLRVADAQAAADVEIAKAEQAADGVRLRAEVAGQAIVEAAKTKAAQIISDAETQTADARARAQVLSDALKAVGG
jgi:hypothetical protein